MRGAWFALLLSASLPAAAEGAHSIELAGSDDGCPSRRSVAACLQEIFPDARILLPGEAQPELRVELEDRGAQFGVAAGAVSRSFADELRRCDERARKAAVFVSLVLEPPAVALPAANPPGKRETRSLSLELEIGALFTAAPRSDSNDLFSGGGQLRLFLGSRFVGGVVGLTAASPTLLDLTGAQARLTRVSVDLGVRGRFRRGRFGFAGDAALLLTGQVTRGEQVAASLEESRLELGIRLAARGELWLWKRFAPFLAFQAEVIPVPSQLVLPMAGIVGTTPRVWVGGVLGLAIRLR